MPRLRAVIALALVALLPSAGHCQQPALLAVWDQFGRPWHMAFDAAGNLYVADKAMQHVFVLTGNGVPITSWTGPLPAPPNYFFPSGIAVGPDGHVLVTTPDTNGPPVFLLASFTRSGEYLGSLGSIGTGAGQICRPFDVAVDGSGNIYLADNSNMKVVVLRSDGSFVTEWGSYGSGPGQFHMPLAIVVSPGGWVYVTDDDNQRVEVFTTGGAFVTQWGSYGGGPGQLAGPWGIALDAAGNVYVADAANYRIQVFTSTGQYLGQWGTAGSAPGQFNKPIGVRVGPDGRIYVADTFNGRIQVFGAFPTPTRPVTWGGLKVSYR
jgi:tripartite motif-containing protein 71